MKGPSAALRVLAGGLLLGCMGASVRQAHASVNTINYRVNTAAGDPGDADTGCNAYGTAGTCSLAGAISDANAAPTGSIVNINVPAFHIYLTSDNLDVDASSSVTTNIKGTSEAGTIIDGVNDPSGYLLYNYSPLSVSNLTLENGHSSLASEGQALYAESALAVNSVLFSNNDAGTSGYGGAIYTDSFNAVSISNSTFIGNRAEYGGAIYNYDAYMSITNSTFKNNVACTSNPCSGSGDGGAIYNDETLNVTGGTLSGNQAGALSSDDGYGGAFYNEYNLQVTGALVSGNTAGSDGGGFYNDDYTTVTNTTVSGNASGSYGGGIEEEDRGSYSNDRISGNVAGGSTSDSDGYGGGMYADDYVLVSTSVFSNNKALGYTGSFSDAKAPFVHTTASKTPLVSNRGHYGSVPARGMVASQVSDPCGGYGGGFYNDDTVTFNGVVFQNNGACDGGGLYDSDEYVNMNGGKFVANSASYNGGAVYEADSSTGGYDLLHNVLVIANTAGNESGGIYNVAVNEPVLTGTTSLLANSAPTCPNLANPCS